MKRFAILLLILLIPMAFGYTLKWPDKEPNIIQITKQVYEPGIMIVATDITGTISYPDYDLVAPGAVQENGGTTGGASGIQNAQLIVGTWYYEGPTQMGNTTAEIIFNANGTFLGYETYADIAQNYVYSGTYGISGSTLTMNYTSLTINDIAQNPMSVAYGLSFPNNNSMSITVNNIALTYTRTSGALAENEEQGASLQDEEATIQAIEALEFVPKEGADAKQIDETVQTGMAGTGFVINPDGYLVTNAHVVYASESEAANKVFNALFAGIQEGIYQDIQARYNLTAEQKERAIKAISEKFINYIAQYGQLTDLKIDNYVMPGILLPGQILINVAWNAEIKKVGQVVEETATTISAGKDIAIIKVNQKNLLAVKLGDSDKVSTGEQIFVIGYPDTGIDFVFDNKQTIEPTVTSGIVSARRMMTNNIEVIQTDAAINHGNSGGPVFNDKGEVIGLATFGSDEVQNISFIMPINLAKEFMNEINVENETGIVGEKFKEGVEAYFKKDCVTTEKAMQQVLTLSPGLPYAQEYIKSCQEARITGLYKEDYTMAIVIPIVIIAIAGAGAFYFLKIRKKK